MGAEKDIFGLEPAAPSPWWAGPLGLLLLLYLFVASAAVGGLWLGLAVRIFRLVAGV